MLEAFVACAPGLEPLLHAELEGLGVGALGPRESGGAAIRLDPAALHRLMLEVGLGSHVLVRMATFRAHTFAELERAASDIEWTRWLREGEPRSFRAKSRASRLYHTGAIVERIERAVTAQLGAPGEGETPELATSTAATPAIVARFDRDICTLSLDVSGEPLHRRGYRLASTKAPLREDLARALVIASGWDRAEPLADPFCGAGTIAIEAAMLARSIAPGLLRPFALERSALFDEELAERARGAARARILPRAPGRIFASDRDEGAVRATRDNAARAGVASDLHVSVAALGAAAFLEAPADHGAIVTDPPHGRRLGDGRRLRSLYQSLGRIVRELPPAWKVALTATDRRLALASGLPLETALLTDHGGAKLRFLVAAPRLSEP